MICLDTTVLIDLWRCRGREGATVVRCLSRYGGEREIVPSLVAGEFYEGGACLGEERLRASILFLERFTITGIKRETALLYARMAAELGGGAEIGAISKIDLWIAACAMEHGATLITRNPRDFSKIRDLKIEGYAVA